VPVSDVRPRWANARHECMRADTSMSAGETAETDDKRRYFELADRRALRSVRICRAFVSRGDRI